MFSIKEQLILLQCVGFTYSEKCNYLTYYLKNLKYQALSIDNIIEIFKMVNKENIKHISKFNQLRNIPYEIINQYITQSIMIGENEYPKLWYEIYQPPLLIYYSGNIDLLNKPAISIVGTRKITSYGISITEQFVKESIKKDWCCVSGLANGVDTVVHQTAINFADYSSIAIIPTGLDCCYPRSNQNLQRQMMKKQLVLSEYLPHQKAQKHHFIMRNRLVAGLTPATIVIESAKNSGSLITANYALQFNREVYAVPGKINDIYSQGCNEIIEAGASIVLSVNHTLSSIEELMTAHHII